MAAKVVVLQYSKHVIKYLIALLELVDLIFTKWSFYDSLNIMMSNNVWEYKQEYEKDILVITY